MAWYCAHMETNGISEHLYRIYVFVRDAKTWVTNKDIETGAKVSGRTARAHSLRLVKAGVFDQAEIFPGHRYRVTAKADKRSRGYVQRLEQAGIILSSFSDSESRT